MSRFPAAVRQLFFQSFRSEDGNYAVKLYNPKISEWQWVSVDDSVPAEFYGNPKYAQLAADRTLWVLLLEKAVAKLVEPGPKTQIGYDKLHWGFYGFAQVLLTGTRGLDYFAKQNGHIKHCPDGPRFVENEYPSWQSGQKDCWKISDPSTLDTVWESFLLGTKGNRLMTGLVAQAHQERGEPKEATGETRQADGLYGGHIYSILQAKQFAGGASYGLVCMERITVTYTSSETWKADMAFMKEVWWLPNGTLRFCGSTWDTSQASRHGVAEGWSLVDPQAFEGPEPSTLGVRKIVFTGVVDDVACSSEEKDRSGRQTHWVTKSVTSLPEGAMLRLLQVRNPWGNSKMWTGAWSDSDRRWAAHPDVADMLGFAPLEDGMSWMTLEDFAERFHDWGIGEVDMLQFSTPDPEQRNSNSKRK